MTMAVAKYRDHLTRHGEVLTLKRIVPNQPDQTLGTVRARVTGYAPKEIASGIAAGNRKAILLAEDLASFSPPVRKNDRLVTASGVTLTVVSVNGSTRKIGNTILAYDCEVSGAPL